MALQMPSGALFGLSIQGDGTPSNTGFGTAETTGFMYYLLSDLAMGPVKNQNTLPPEIGGRALPSGAFATGTHAEGTVSLIPRLDNRLGWLLLAAMGEVSTVADTTIANYILGGSGADAGINTHVFRFYSTDQFWVPYCTIHRLLPHTTAASTLGETYQDGRVRSLTLTAAGASPVTCDLDMIARLEQSGGDIQFDYGASWAATYDDFDDFAVTNCSGHFKIEDTEFDVTNIAVTLTNNLLPAEQAMKIGSIHPIDFPVLGRVAAVTAPILVDDYELYVSTFEGIANAGTDTDATCIVYKADVDVEFTTQTYITGTEPYRIRIRSNVADDNVAWQVSPIRVQPNQPIVLQVMASVLATSTGDPLLIFLQNATANYNL